MAGKEGVSHTFFTQLDKPRAGELVNVLREANQPVCVCVCARAGVFQEECARARFRVGPRIGPGGPVPEELTKRLHKSKTAVSIYIYIYIYIYNIASAGRCRRS